MTVNGAVFEYPVNFDEGWGVDATGWAQAVTNGMLQLAGGSFPLTADVNFGPNFGLLSKYFETRSAFPASTGTVRLSPADAGVVWRNNAHSGDLTLTTDASDNLVWSGNLLLQNTNSLKLQDTGNAHTISVHAPSTTATYTITLPPNTGSNGQVLQTDGSGTTTWVNATGTGTVNTGTSGQLAYYAASSNVVSGSPLLSQTATALQISTGGLSVRLTNDGANTFTLRDETNSVDFLVYNNFGSNTLALGVELGAQGHGIHGLATPTFFGDALAYGKTFDMGSTKITGLANGTASDDATAFGQVQYAFQAAVQTTTTATTAINSNAYQATSIAATITPTSSSSRIKITAYIAGLGNSSGSNLFLTLFRGATDLGAPTVGFFKSAPNAGELYPVTLNYIDSPATTSATTYTVYTKSSTNAPSGSVNTNGCKCTMILEELR